MNLVLGALSVQAQSSAFGSLPPLKLPLQLPAAGLPLTAPAAVTSTQTVTPKLTASPLPQIAPSLPASVTSSPSNVVPKVLPSTPGLSRSAPDLIPAIRSAPTITSSPTLPGLVLGARPDALTPRGLPIGTIQITPGVIAHSQPAVTTSSQRLTPTLILAHIERVGTLNGDIVRRMAPRPSPVGSSSAPDSVTPTETPTRVDIGSLREDAPERRSESRSDRGMGREAFYSEPQEMSEPDQRGGGGGKEVRDMLPELPGFGGASAKRGDKEQEELRQQGNTANAGQQQENWVEMGELVLLFDSARAAQEATQWLKSRYKVEPAASVPLGSLGMTMLLITMEQQDDADTLLAAIQKQKPDWITDLNTRYVTQQAQSTPPAAPVLYASKMLALPSERFTPPNGLRIGLLDGGITDAQKLGLRLGAQQSFLFEEDESAQDLHGSVMASLIASSHVGVEGLASGASLWLAEVVRRSGEHASANTVTLVRALDWMLKEKVQFINISLAGPGDPLLEKAIAKLLTAGVTVVASAGNFGPKADPAYPAAYPGVIAVTAIDANGQIFAKAGQGEHIVLSAPGVDVWSAAAGRYVSGTSVATAQVTGVLARLAARKLDQIKPAQLLQLACSSAKDLGSKGRDAIFGCGLLQADALAKALR